MGPLSLTKWVLWLMLELAIRGEVLPTKHVRLKATKKTPSILELFIDYSFFYNALEGLYWQL
jgi:hypothetical protein